MPNFVQINFMKKGKVEKEVKGNEKPNDELIRLNKYIANSGICSRREADEMIKNGLVKVNGKVVTEMGHKVKLTDKVAFENKEVNPEKSVYVLLNKPKDFITTTKDTHGRKTVMDLVKKACKERIYPVGRLDRDTTGLLLFTNDGELAKKLTHPSYEVRKLYHVTLNKEVEAEDIKQLLKGIELEDGIVKADAAAYVTNAFDRTEVGIELHSGKKRVVRRLFIHLGYEVIKLDRVLFGGLSKKDLPRGKFRMLTKQEIGDLKKITKGKPIHEST